MVHPSAGVAEHRNPLADLSDDQLDTIYRDLEVQRDALADLDAELAEPLTGPLRTVYAEICRRNPASVS